MADSRRDPEPGDLLTCGKQMIVCTERQGKLVRYQLRLENGATLEGLVDTEQWFEMVANGTPAGKVKVEKFSVQ
jgi:hypothetical protein